MARPTIICLCGSTRFHRTFAERNFFHTLAGKIVLSIGCDTKSDNENFVHMTPDKLAGVKARLDELHLRKIDLADGVEILNVGGYIGESTRREMEYARARGKPVSFLESHPTLTPAQVEEVLGGTPAARPLSADSGTRHLPLVFVVGARGSGKSTFGALLATQLGVRCAETSAVLIRRLADVCAAMLGPTEREGGWESAICDEKDDEYCGGSYRKALIELGNQITADDPVTLARECWTQGAGVIVGVRRFAEYAACRRCWPSAVWLLLEREHGVGVDNFESKALREAIGPQCVLQNSGGLGDLARASTALAETIKRGASVLQRD